MLPAIAFLDSDLRHFIRGGKDKIRMLNAITPTVGHSDDERPKWNRVQQFANASFHGSKLVDAVIFTSGKLQEFVAGFFQYGDHLFPFYTRESFQKIIYRIAAFQMIKQALHRYARSDEYRPAAEDRGVAVDNRLPFHSNRIIETGARSKLLHPR